MPRGVIAACLLWLQTSGAGDDEEASRMVQQGRAAEAIATLEKRVASAAQPPVRG
jgi:tellurite resistance protein